MDGTLLTMLPALVFCGVLIVASVFFIRLMMKATQYLSFVNYEKSMMLQKGAQDTSERSNDRR